MKKIIFHTSSFNTFWAHYFFITDPVFIEIMQTRGYYIEYSNNSTVEKDDYILYLEVKSLGKFNYIFPYLNTYNKFKFLIKSLLSFNNKKIFKTVYKNISILLILESQLEAPENHVVYIEKYCNRVLTWNDNLVNNTNILKSFIPQPLFWESYNKISFYEKKLLVNISGNKNSNNKLELYTKRQEVISFFEKKLPDSFDLFGIGWNEKQTIFEKIGLTKLRKFKSYRGIAKNKSEIYSKYKFGLIFENSIVNGYISEKIFDCMRSGCVPIYLGAPNIEEYVDSNTFISYNNFNSNEELLNYLSQISEGEYEKYLKNIQQYLDSDLFDLFTVKNYANLIADTFDNIIIP